MIWRLLRPLNMDGRLLGLLDMAERVVKTDGELLETDDKNASEK